MKLDFTPDSRFWPLKYSVSCHVPTKDRQWITACPDIVFESFQVEIQICSPGSTHLVTFVPVDGTDKKFAALDALLDYITGAGFQVLVVDEDENGYQIDRECNVIRQWYLEPGTFLGLNV